MTSHDPFGSLEDSFHKAASPLPSNAPRSPAVLAQPGQNAATQKVFLRPAVTEKEPFTPWVMAMATQLVVWSLMALLFVAVLNFLANIAFATLGSSLGSSKLLLDCFLSVIGILKVAIYTWISALFLGKLALFFSLHSWSNLRIFMGILLALDFAAIAIKIIRLTSGSGQNIAPNFGNASLPQFGILTNDVLIPTSGLLGLVFYLYVPSKVHGLAQDNAAKLQARQDSIDIIKFIVFFFVCTFAFFLFSAYVLYSFAPFLTGLSLILLNYVVWPLCWIFTVWRILDLWRTCNDVMASLILRGSHEEPSLPQNWLAGSLVAIFVTVLMVLPVRGGATNPSATVVEFTSQLAEKLAPLDQPYLEAIAGGDLNAIEDLRRQRMDLARKAVGSRMANNTVLAEMASRGEFPPPPPVELARPYLERLQQKTRKAIDSQQTETLAVAIRAAEEFRKVYSNVDKDLAALAEEITREAKNQKTNIEDNLPRESQKTKQLEVQKYHSEQRLPHLQVQFKRSLETLDISFAESLYRQLEGDPQTPDRDKTLAAWQAQLAHARNIQSQAKDLIQEIDADIKAARNEDLSSKLQRLRGLLGTTKNFDYVRLNIRVGQIELEKSTRDFPVVEAAIKAGELDRAQTLLDAIHGRFEPQVLPPRYFDLVAQLQKARSLREEAMALEQSLASVAENIRLKNFPEAVSNYRALPRTPPHHLAVFDLWRQLPATLLEHADTPFGLATRPVVAALAKPLPPDKETKEKIVNQLRASRQLIFSTNAPNGRREVAKDILRRFPNKALSSDEQYVHLRMARDTALATNDLRTAIFSALAIAETYDGDTAEMLTWSVQMIGRLSPDPNDFQVIVGWVRTHAGVMTRQTDDPDDILASFRAAHDLAQRSGNKAAVEFFKILSQQFSKQQRYLVKQAQKLLETSSATAAHMALLGQFHCLVQGEWDLGLPFLARGDNPQLADLARADITATDPLDPGDRWWRFATTTEGFYALRARQRAIAWYKIALNKTDLSAADRSDINRRLAVKDLFTGDTAP